MILIGGFLISPLAKFFQDGTLAVVNSQSAPESLYSEVRLFFLQPCIIYISALIPLRNAVTNPLRLHHNNISPPS